jgi:hypothetical protein
MKKIFLDFDGIYQHKYPPTDTIVLASSYSAAWIVNVNNYTQCRKDAYIKFEIFFNDILKSKVSSDIIINKVHLFNSFFFPISQWISAIDLIIKREKIDLSCHVIFSSYVNNPKVFLLEAEGETNSQFLYKKSYFLSYYINKYLHTKGYSNIICLRDRKIEANLAFFSRGMIFLHIKFFELIFYKLFIWKRFYGRYKSIDCQEKALAVSSRGIVQSQFIEGLYLNMKNLVLSN